MLINKFFQIPKELISALETVKRYNEGVRLTNYLTDGQLVTLFYEFENDFEILLIDEPETSMHIDWQRNLISDIILNLEYFGIEDEEITGYYGKGCHVICTTHSPDVIMNHIDLVTDMTQEYPDELV